MPTISHKLDGQFIQQPSPRRQDLTLIWANKPHQRVRWQGRVIH